jgi:hypothetical protein
MDVTEFVFKMVFGNEYASPFSECSEYKGIPMSERHTPEMKRFIKNNNFRVRYRGPRRKAWNRNGRLTVTTLGRQDCLKADALNFSLYKA